jgi:hypothetical protein
MAFPRLMFGMAPPLVTLLTGRNVPKSIRGSAEPRPSIITEKAVADFTRVVEAADVLDRQRSKLGTVRDQN